MIFQGWWTLGVKVGDTPDIRVAIVMSSFSGETEKASVNIADLTALDEFDGLGYTRLDCAGVAITYDSGSHEMRIDFDNGAGDEFGDPVTAGTAVAYGFILYVHVDGTDANDILIGFTTDGAGINANGGKLGLSIPAAGWFVSDEA